MRIVLSVMLVCLIISCVAATAQFFRLPIGPGSQEPLGPSGSGGGSGPPPVGCTGTIDLSTGCVQPMLGGL